MQIYTRYILQRHDRAYRRRCHHTLSSASQSESQVSVKNINMNIVTDPYWNLLWQESKVFKSKLEFSSPVDKLTCGMDKPMIVFILSMQHCLMGAHTHHTSVDRHKRFGCLIPILHGSNSVYFYEIHKWRQLLMCTHISVISSLKGEEKKTYFH